MEDPENLVVDLIIKFGGSAITQKEKLETVNPESLQAATRIIQECAAKKLTYILVHGAGSFGHHHAKQYKVNSGFSKDGKTDQTTKTGLCLTRLSVTKLNRIVVESLVSASIPAVGLQALGSWTTHDAAVTRHNVAGVRQLLLSGFVPVLYGDCVLDTHKGCNVLSGDDIIKTMCREVPVKRVVFLTDVPGVFDKPPTEQGAKLLPKIFVKKDGTITQDIHTSNSNYDVTGGILHKIETAVDIVSNSKRDTDVYVCQVTSDAAKEVCCHGDNHISKKDSFTHITSKTEI